MTEQEETVLKAALFDLIGAVGNLDRHDAALDAAEDRLTMAIKDLIALRAWRVQAEPLLRALARLDPINYSESDDWVCLLCSATTPHLLDDADDNDTQARLQHAATCPVTLARALLKEE